MVLLTCTDIDVVAREGTEFEIKIPDHEKHKLHFFHHLVCSTALLLYIILGFQLYAKK